MNFGDLLNAMATTPVAAVAALEALAIAALVGAVAFLFKKLMEAHDKIEAAKDSAKDTALSILPVATKLSDGLAAVDRMLGTVERMAARHD